MALLAVPTTSHSRLQQDTAPIAKRVNWFISDSASKLPATKKYLLEDNREITQGVYFCCGGGSLASGRYRVSSIDFCAGPEDSG